MSNCGITILKIPFECEYIVQGDTITKTSFEVIEDGLDLTNADISLIIKHGNENVIDVSVGNGITVIDSENFEIDQVEAINNNFEVGTFEGDLTITDTLTGDVFTYTRVSYTIIKKY
jgi:hypothetical protein